MCIRDRSTHASKTSMMSFFMRGRTDVYKRQDRVPAQSSGISHLLFPDSDRMPHGQSSPAILLPSFCGPYSILSVPSPHLMPPPHSSRIMTDLPGRPSGALRHTLFPPARHHRLPSKSRSDYPHTEKRGSSNNDSCRNSGSPVSPIGSFSFP